MLKIILAIVIEPCMMTINKDNRESLIKSINCNHNQSNYFEVIDGATKQIQITVKPPKLTDFLIKS